MGRTKSNMVKSCVALLLTIGLVAAAPPFGDDANLLENASEGQDCTKEEFAKKFGATYTLMTEPIKPSLQNGFVVAKVAYKSRCPDARSSFTASIKKKSNMEIVFMSRTEPECPVEAQLATAVQHSEIVSVPLPAEAGTDRKLLAFPPDGEFELWLLEETDGSVLEASATVDSLASETQRQLAGNQVVS